MDDAHAIAIFAGGCFWCTEAIFRELKGVASVMPGYTGGAVKNPTYEQVSSGATGHAEAIKIDYNPDAISYHDLLTVFFATHDPTSLNRQGNDIGTQYRSAVFYVNEEQKKEAEEFIANLNTEGEKVVTELKPFEAFYEAESYHREYYKNNFSQPYCQLVINPKIKKLEKEFSELIKRV